MKTPMNPAERAPRWNEPFRDLGNLSAVEPVYQVSLECAKCRVQWIGCFDAAACPECGDHEDWDRLMEARGYYKPIEAHLRAGPVEAESLDTLDAGPAPVSDSLAYFTRTDPGQSLPGECVHSFFVTRYGFKCSHCGMRMGRGEP